MILCVIGLCRRDKILRKYCWERCVGHRWEVWCKTRGCLLVCQLEIFWSHLRTHSDFRNVAQHRIIFVHYYNIHLYCCNWKCQVFCLRHTSGCLCSSSSSLPAPPPPSQETQEHRLKKKKMMRVQLRGLGYPATNTIIADILPAVATAAVAVTSVSASTIAATSLWRNAHWMWQPNSALHIVRGWSHVGWSNYLASSIEASFPSPRCGIPLYGTFPIPNYRYKYWSGRPW